MNEGTIKADVLSEDAEALCALLAKFPGLSYEAKGSWPVKSFTISGPPASLAELKPHLDQWQEDCISRDAW